jgi:hypothetical protein
MPTALIIFITIAITVTYILLGVGTYNLVQIQVKAKNLPVFTAVALWPIVLMDAAINKDAYIKGKIL